MDLSNFATVVRFICKQLNSSELRVKWLSQSQNKRLQSTVPLGPIETNQPAAIPDRHSVRFVAKYGPAGTD